MKPKKTVTFTITLDAQEAEQLERLRTHVTAGIAPRATFAAAMLRLGMQAVISKDAHLGNKNL